jgi:magnesium-transporting ATPase (P-type)
LTICGKNNASASERFPLSFSILHSAIVFSPSFASNRYIGFNKDAAEKWPYLPDLEAPIWKPANSNWIQTFLLFSTLLTNFVPLSLYVTIEFVTLMIRFLINNDIDMYHEGTDTRALARSTNVTDLGQVQYVFSDKTGTLTQNVMGFKRCSVDGMIFGAPIEKARVGDHGYEKDDEGPTSSFHPLRQLLVGKTKPSGEASSSRAGLEPLGGTTGDTLALDDKLTFNAEMFLRVMSLCHTVVVEKDMDAVDTLNRPGEKMTSSEKSSLSSSLHRAARKVFGKKNSSSTDESGAPASSDNENLTAEEETNTSSTIPTGISKDGAPIGYAYQAESPDEGALVQGASCSFGFQVIGRDSSGIKLACSSPSLLEDEQIANGLKNGTLTPKVLAVETATDLSPPGSSSAEFHNGNVTHSKGSRRIEIWAILAVNKFDSDRKRMSVLVRAPPEFGSIPILFCKGADSSMLDANICEESENIMSGRERQEDIDVLFIPKPTSINRNLPVDNHMDPLLEDDSEGDEDGWNRKEAAENWESAAMLGIQAHLGTFAKEGLRTLVLGMRVLSERQCEEWLSRHTAASTSLKKREEKLTEVAKEIERHLHIVGATAIEDKLQRGVSETIAKLEEAGIKLWVLTGDKRETAIEIGYSSHVLTPKMHLTEVSDGPADDVRTLMAMEFIRLVKMGKLTEYQRTVLSRDPNGLSLMEFILLVDFKFRMGKLWRRFSRALRRFFWVYVCCRYKKAKGALSAIEHEESLENEILQVKMRRANVRDRAEKIIQAYLQSPQGKEHSERRKSQGVHHGDDASDALSLASDELPDVFNRAESARMLLEQRRSQGKLTKSEVRTLSLVQLTAQQAADHFPLVDEDTLSLRSFMPDDRNDTAFDRKKRTLLERVFAVDKQVRHGRLRKHARPEALQSIEEEDAGHGESTGAHDRSRPRALVIEGAALAHLLGDSELEELLFAVASCSDSVIACRVSPKQKALLVHLVRTYVSPEPMTLAIGDGANDVGMIQEAHVGIGISGKEGQQAVNASDFAIAQFRFLEELLLIHGRWSFFRESTVVLFSFYKNAVLAGCLILFSSRALYSGTPLFDDWLIAMLNFICGWPIMLLGFFDQCLSKEYVRNHPEVYGPGRRNELITGRTLFRWIILVVVHVFCIYYLTVPPQIFGGGITSAFSGLMSNEDWDVPGNGEGGDLKSVGTVSFSCMVILFAYKVGRRQQKTRIVKGQGLTCLSFFV